MASPSTSWPMYFLTRDPIVKGRRLGACRAGDPFPWQDKRIIRGVGNSFGVANAETAMWSTLDYVTTINVHSEDQRRSLMERGATLQAAQDLLCGTVTDEVATAVKPRRGRPPRSAEAQAHG